MTEQNDDARESPSPPMTTTGTTTPELNIALTAKVLVLIEVREGSNPEIAVKAALAVAQELRFTQGVKEVYVYPLPGGVL